MLFIAALSTKFGIWAKRQRSLARTAAKPASLDDLIADVSDEARHSKDDPSGALYVGKDKSRDRGDNKKKCSHCKKRHFGGADRRFVKYLHQFKRKMEERQKTEAKEEDNKNKTTTPGNRHQAMLPGPLKSATGSTSKLVKRFDGPYSSTVAPKHQ